MNEHEFYEKEYTNEAGETKKLKDIIDINHDVYEHRLHSGQVLKRFIKKTGVMKIASFFGVTFSKPEIVQEPQKWNNYSYAISIDARFPNGEVYTEIGENAANDDQHHRYTFAFQRAKNRAILNSNTVGLYNLLSEEEQAEVKEILEPTTPTPQGTQTGQQNHEDRPYTKHEIDSTINDIEKKLGINKLYLPYFILPENSPKHAGKSLFEVYENDPTYLNELREIYPQNQDLIKCVNAIQVRVRFDERFNTQLLKTFHDEYQQYLQNNEVTPTMFVKRMENLSEMDELNLPKKETPAETEQTQTIPSAFASFEEKLNAVQVENETINSEKPVSETNSKDLNDTEVSDEKMPWDVEESTNGDEVDIQEKQPSSTPVTIEESPQKATDVTVEKIETSTPPSKGTGDMVAMQKKDDKPNASSEKRDDGFNNMVFFEN